MGATTLLLSGLLQAVPAGARIDPGQRVVLALAPVSEEALHRCKAADLRKALKQALGHSKRVRYLPELEDAPARLEVLACTRVEEHRQTRTTKRDPVKGPTEGGVAEGTDTEVGLQSWSLKTVILRGRLMVGARSLDVASQPNSRTLDEAAGSLRHAIDAAVADHGDWLFASDP